MGKMNYIKIENFNLSEEDYEDSEKESHIGREITCNTHNFYPKHKESYETMKLANEPIEKCQETPTNNQ